ncbi:MAG: hypothetical protein AAGF95_12920 [Chloroflexota bacterium]
MKYILQWWPWNRRKSKTQKYLDWFAFQRWLLETGAEIPPPWVAYPNQAPWSGGWRQGNGEAWLHEVWLPFWRTLGPKERHTYVEKWNAPSEWREYLISPGHWS